MPLMKLNTEQENKIIKDFKAKKLKLLKGHPLREIYKMNLGKEKLYFIAVKRKSYSEVNFTSLIYEDTSLFNRLMRLKSDGFKKVLFVVGNNFHWLSV